MRKNLLIISISASLLGLVLIGPRGGWAYPVLLQYSSGEVLYNSDGDPFTQTGTPLESGALVQLIYSQSGIISPPNPSTGGLQGDNILWATTTIDAGRFSDSIFYESTVWQPGFIYVRFWNAPTIQQATYFGLSPLHALSDFFGFETWDITAGGLFLYTEYPFMIIPEPETWLTLLPGMALAAFVFRKKKNRREKLNPINRREV